MASQLPPFTTFPLINSYPCRTSCTKMRRASKVSAEVEAVCGPLAWLQWTVPVAAVLASML
eukprot:817445-Pelagomonas_calceolata.AAC.2